jgi:hypothetical protein
LERKNEPAVFSFMDRSFEEIRAEVLELDRESQRRLADEIEENLSEPDEEWRAEIKRRLEEYQRGGGTSVTAEESIVNARRKLEQAKRDRGWL